MMEIPRLRWRGPVEQRDATILLSIAAFMITARIPMGFVALLVLPAVAVLVQGVRRGRRTPAHVQWLLVICASTAVLGVLSTNPAMLAGTGNNVVVVAAIALVSTAIFRGHHRQRAMTRLFDGLYAGLLFSWALSIFEALTGFKFLPLLYPDGNTAAAITANRFFVAALFPNFNDYSVAMAILYVCVLARVLFQPRVSARATAGRWMILLSTTFFITLMGSRGALGGLILGTAMLLVMSVRVVRPRAIGIRTIFATVTTALVGLAMLATSPWVQDNSTATRGRIASNVGLMLADDPARAVVGYGGTAEYLRAARRMFGNLLMDPHNMLLEFVVGYGIPGLLAYLACWWILTRRGVLALRVNPGWRTAAACVITALYPLLGLVTSSTLRYHQVWLWLLVAAAGVPATRTPPRTTTRS